MKKLKRTLCVLLVLLTVISLFTIPAAAASLEDVTASFAGKTIVVKSVQNGKYLTANSARSGVPLTANRSSHSDWEYFQVTAMTSDGWVGLKAHNGKYLSASIDVSGAPVRARSGHLQAWECFRIYRCGSNYYIKAQANGKWLCAHVNESGSPVRADAAAASSWERYAISIYGVPNDPAARYPVRYVEKTVTLDCSGASVWTASLANGLKGLDGLIVGQKVLSWKTLRVKVPVTTNVNGSPTYTIETLKVPARVTYQLHTHEASVGYGRSFRYENGCIVTCYSCSCGLRKDLVLWEIPLPDPADAQTTQSVINWLPQINR